MPAPNATVTSAVVAEGVVDLSTGKTEIYQWGVADAGAFEFNAMLMSVRLPESLKKIGDNAFANCQALVHIDIPSGVNDLGRCTFRCCKSLRTVTVPDGVVALPLGIFHSCISLKSVTLPSSLKSIGNSAFGLCSSLTTINDDALVGVTEIGRVSFQYCSSLTSFKLPPLLTTIKFATFGGCQNLSKVQLPPRLEVIEPGVFGKCYHPDLCIDIPPTLKCVVVHVDAEDLTGTSKKSVELRKQRWANTMGYRIRLPTSLEFLSHGVELGGLFQGVREVLISSRVNVKLLAKFMDLFASSEVNGERFLPPDLMFKVLHYQCDIDSGDDELPPIESHVPVSTFSYDMSLGELQRTAELGKSLVTIVDKAYKKSQRKKQGRGKKKRG